MAEMHHEFPLLTTEGDSDSPRAETKTSVTSKRRHTRARAYSRQTRLR